LFWFAYTEDAMATLWGPPFDRLARHGREFGLAFASAQLVHVGLILLSGSGAGMAFFWVGIVFTYLLALFSLPSVHNAMGPRLWRISLVIALNYIALLAIFVRRRRVAWLEIDCEVGELCEREIAGTKYRLTIHSVKRGDEETAPYVADVEVIKGPQLSLVGGCDTKENGNNRFWMPVTPSHRTVTGGIYELGIHEAVLKISVVRIDHINLVSNKVILTLRAISWRL
jgi:hypothetical protein